jgi:membrane fusion protein, multidrug efflux system
MAIAAVMCATGSAGQQPEPVTVKSARFLDQRGAERIRGLVVARQQATISAALQSTVLTIGPENGERFAKGDVLVTFDCRIHEAELKRARAIAEAAKDTLDAKATLASSGSIARLQVTLADAELKKARADVVVAETRVAYCDVPAPYSGRVVRRIANAHETVAARDPVIEIVDDSAFEVRAFVPSHWLGVVGAGSPLVLKIDETGESLSLQTITIGAMIDNVSQLIEVRAAVDIKIKGLVAGMSGDIEQPRVAGLAR